MEGADLNAQDGAGRTPAHVAVFASNNEALRALAAAGANMNALEHQAYDVVTIAAVASDPDLVNLAIELGYRADLVTSPYDGTALIAAAHLGHAEVGRRLIAGGAPRMEANAECMLVLIGATPEGKKKLLGFQTGVRESAQSWRELLVDVKRRGLAIAPDLAIGDGALGFWKAIEEVFPVTRHQRCWVHKMANVLNKVARSVQVNMKVDLREIYGAPTRAAAETAIDLFADKYGAKYDRAVACLTKDREALLAFFDFPAEHWDHLRTSNPIESVFATVRHRTVRTKGSLSQRTARLMVFKLVQAAAKTWRRLKGENQLPKVVRGGKFHNGVEVVETTNHSAA